MDEKLEMKPADNTNQTVKPTISNQVEGSATQVIQTGNIGGNLIINEPKDRLSEMPIVVTVEHRLEHFEATSIFDILRPAHTREYIQVTVENLEQQAVILKSLQPVIQPGQNLKNSFPVLIRPFFNAVIAPRIFFADLAFPPRLIESKDAPTFPFKVTSGDPEIFRIEARYAGEVDWHLELRWTSAGREEIIALELNDTPCRAYSPPSNEHKDT